MEDIDYGLFEDFVDQLSSENCRSMIIFGVANIDLLLYSILKKYFLPSRKKEDELLEGDTPLSTLSSKINICFRLGIINYEFFTVLHLLRSIRNDFAHQPDADYKLSPYKDRIRNFVDYTRKMELFGTVKEVYSLEKAGMLSDLAAGIIVVCATLQAINMKTKPKSNEMTINLFS